MMGRIRKQWSRHIGWHLVLALFMLFMQQAGWRHALQHATRDEGAPTHTVCLECLAHHASDASVAPTVPSLPLATFDHVLTADAAQPQCGQGVARCYQPRAPPWVFSA
ncbi:MAG: hypothetical protein EKK47_10300 [Burkholderiales bacterium]|nr:MAG: hypothetical protein EKK47_10300 [Burkholderiales bacterium]